MIDNEKFFGPSFFTFLNSGLVTAEIVIDYLQTASGLKRGFVENNPIARFLQKKIGQMWTAFVGTLSYILGLAVFGTYSMKYALIYSGIVAAIEGYNVFVSNPKAAGGFKKSLQ